MMLFRLGAVVPSELAPYRRVEYSVSQRSFLNRKSRKTNNASVHDGDCITTDHVLDVIQTNRCGKELVKVSRGKILPYLLQENAGP